MGEAVLEAWFLHLLRSAGLLTTLTGRHNNRREVELQCVRTGNAHKRECSKDAEATLGIYAILDQGGDSILDFKATATWRPSHHHRSHRAAVTVSATSKMCPGNWLWASMTFMARFSRSSSRSPVRTRGPLEEMPTVQHPFLNVFELERLLYTGKTACNHADEVWPGLYLGDQDIANNHRELRRLGITHVLNASHSRWRGTPEAYEGLGIRYLGVEAHDSPAFDMSIHFQTAADFIHRALSQPGGKILVHCAVGVSRSATLVLAYLMLYHRLTLVEAIKKVKDHRGIIPNRGFLRQLLALDRRLRQGLEA